MKKKNLKKLLLAVCCAALLVCVSIGATVAYLTSREEVKNTFTVGKVKITLDEAAVNDEGQPILDTIDGTIVVDDPADATRCDGNQYKLMPGHTYTKDPTVTVKAGSEESYVRMLVTVTIADPDAASVLPAKLDGIVLGYEAKWQRYGDVKMTKDETKVTYSYEYRYFETVAGVGEDGKEADKVLPALFTGIKIPDDWTKDTLEKLGGMTGSGFSVDIVAEAIQKDGFETADKAWTAFDKANP